MQDMYNGVKAMILKELELAPKPKVEEKDVAVGTHMKSSKELTGFQIFPDGCKSLLKKNLTKEIWAKLKDVKDSHGFTFKKAIFSGC